ncbi:MAG: hypothetical protein JWP92_1579, partial [Caulobacter sp.]|nr:hypothetical protein [Caulobacter sp.]
MLQSVIRVEGDRKKRIATVATWLVTATLVSLPGLWLVWNEQGQAAAADAAFWSMTGPPCEPLAKTRFYKSSAPPSQTVYEGVLFQRRAGHMMCMRRPYPGRAAEDKFPACRFTGPDYLGVSAAGRESYYDLTGGRSARVGVLDGKIRC